PGGGLHFYFAADDVTNRRGQMPAGIDIRGKGGYVCLPPSPGYRWESEADMVPAPEWLLELLRPSSNGNGPAPVIEGMISEGARHATLLSLAGTMRRRGMLPNEIEAALLEVNKRCHPPQDIADIRRLARDSGRWKVEAAAAPSFDELNELLGLAAIDKRVDVVKMFGRGGRAHVRLELDDGGWIQLDPVGACATPMKLAHEIALQTGAAPEFKTEQVKRVLVLFRLLGEHHEAVTVADMAFELADVYLRDAVVVDVDMNDQASRWRSFSDLVNRRDAILLDSKTGLRYVRIDPFRSYLANHCAPGEPHIVMSELQRAGWKKTGNRGLIKASQPGGRGELVRTFLIVPDDWEEVR
ncbi:MAG: primase C-terminal domain-containing protein, partial [Solirubrobacteraceae bacterium]